MTKKMVAWIGVSLMAGALALACGGSAKKAETTPPAPAATGGASYGNPCAATPASPTTPAPEGAGNPCAPK